MVVFLDVRKKKELTVPIFKQTGCVVRAVGFIILKLMFYFQIECEI